MIRRTLWLASLAILAGSLPAMATPVTFSATNGFLAASAKFEINGSGQLVVTLTNTSGGDVLDQAQLLTGVFFDLGGVGPLTPVSAQVPLGSVAFGSDGGGNVGGEWAYGSGLAGAPHGATEGISSTGLGLFGAPNFNGPDLAPPAAVDGDNYGITSLLDDLDTGNAAVTGGLPLIKNSVVFTLSGTNLGTDASLLSFSNVSFQYGSALTDANITPVPEPATLALLGGGLLGLALRRRR